MRRNDCALLFSTLVLIASASWAQNAPKPQPAQGQSTTLTVQQKSQMQGTALADARVQRVVGLGQTRVMLGESEVDKYEALAYLTHQTDKLPTHRVTVMILNPQTNKAAHVFMAVEQNNVLSVREIPPADVPLFPEEAAEALALAKANPGVQNAVGSRLNQFVLESPGSDASLPLVAQALRVRSVDPNDPCTVDRCLDLIFRTETGYLSLRAGVDLTQRTVEIRKTQHMKGKHQ
jgi:hypothetical protein